MWLSCNDEGGKQWTPSPPNKMYYFPHLQSNLQKAMRRQLHEVCVATSYQMMLQDFPKFLRRLPIILLEDVWPHPRLDYVVWLMAAVTKGWNISKGDVDQLLQIVWEASHQRMGPAYHKKNGFPLFKNDTPKLVKAMIIRQNYGGMKGDQQMLASLVDIWTHKLNGGYDLRRDWPDIGTYTSVEFSDEHRLPEAIDFHNSDIVSQLVSELGIDKETIRKELWDNRSSINVRATLHGSLSLPRYVVDNLSMEIWSTYPSKKKKSDTPSILEFIGSS